MKFIQRTSFYMTSEQRKQIEDLGFKVPPGYGLGSEVPLVAFDAAEDHPNWPVLCCLFKRWNVAPHVEYTEFTPRELDEAPWLQLCAWTNGFPQPQDLHAYARATFDLSHWCSKCSYGKVQNAPFRIKIEPKWGRRGIMTLHWVLEELFVPPAVWETVFKPFGITCRPVVNRSGKQLETVVQLVIDEEVDLVMDRLQVQEVCVGCGRKKYTYSSRGYHPPLAQEPSGALAKTRVAFGDGWGIREVIISQNLRQAMLAHKIRGAEFIPLDHALPAVVA